MFELEKLVRKNITELKPYSSARNDFKGEASVFLDANENSYGSPLKQNFNRYPDPLQRQLKAALTKIKNCNAANIFIGNGSDEVIDLAYRIFCNPGKDNVIICPPTYGMYEVSANINDVEIIKVNLKKDFQLDIEGILKAANKNTKLLFICSPNNPTGNCMKDKDIIELINNFTGIVIIDEAYIDFSKGKSFLGDLNKYPNLIIMQTLSKAWGLAALRLGLAFASLPIINLFNKVKPPYNINKASQNFAIEALQSDSKINNGIKNIIRQRKYLNQEFSGFSFVKNIYPSNSNFLLIKVIDANNLYQYLVSNKIIVRNRSNDVLCENCLRITVGTPAENKVLLNAFKNYV